jgi:integrase
MPWKLVPPRAPYTRCYYVRGKYLRIRLCHSTGTSEADAARRILATWKRQAERGEFSLGGRSEPAPATFVSAATAYMRAGGSGQYLEPILRAWKDRALAAVDQIAVDTLAAELYPKGTAATRNRQVYTPISAVLKRAGIETKIRRPKGWRGNKRTFWLQPESTFRLLDAAAAIEPEFGVLCVLLNYTGMRLGEALDRLTCEAVELQREFAYLPDSKTGEPRAVYLPPVVVVALANHPRGLHRKGRLFRFHDGGRLRDMLAEACHRAGVTLPRRTAFHVFRHNFATWMRLYGGLDALGLTRTGAWADLESVERYAHSEPTAEARQAAVLPTRAAGVQRKTGAA